MGKKYKDCPAIPIKLRRFLGLSRAFLPPIRELKEKSESDS
jgi:hypothetical protein